MSAHRHNGAQHAKVVACADGCHHPLRVWRQAVHEEDQVLDRSFRALARNSHHEIHEQRLRKDTAVAELEVARARVDLARLAVDRTEIRAPFDGVLGFRWVDPGDRVTDETPLVQIDAIERLQVSFGITEQGVAFAKRGAPIQIRVLPYPGESFAGEVFFVSPTLDPAARRLILKAWVPNADERLRPGLFADVDLEVARRENALLVPESAVVLDRHGTFVWRVDDDDTAHRVPIEVGLRKGGRVEVTMGLRPGDTVVMAGTHKVSEGEKLQAAAPASTGQARREATVAAPPGEGT